MDFVAIDIGMDFVYAVAAEEKNHRKQRPTRQTGLFYILKVVSEKNVASNSATAAGVCYTTLEIFIFFNFAYCTKAYS